MLNKILTYIGLLGTIVIFGFFIDVYLTFTELATHNLLLAYGYFGLYLIFIGVIVIYITKFAIEFKKYAVVDDDLKNSFKKIIAAQDNKDSYKVIINKVAILVTNSELAKNDKDEANRIVHASLTTNYPKDIANSLNKMLDKLNEKAKEIVIKEASHVAIITGVSQKSSLDMLIVLYKNVSLIRQLLKLYGYKANPYNTVILIKKIVENITASGAISTTEDLLGDSISSVVGSFVGGISNGILMLRVGNSSMSILSINEFKSIPIKDVVKQLIITSKEAVSKITDKVSGYMDSKKEVIESK